MRLQEYLTEKRETASSFAQRIGVSRVAVTRYCSGRVPERATMEKIIKATDGEVTPNDFYGLPDEGTAGGAA